MKLMHEVPQWIAAIESAASRLADAAARAGLDAPVPTCPGWNVRDLVQHQGGVHRWATSIVGTPRTEGWDADLIDVVGAWPDDEDLIGWLVGGATELAATLRAAPADLRCFTFLAADTPVAMWARRQAHETTIHRIDAEGAAGTATPVPASLASDGVDELLTCFITRRPTPSPTGEIVTMAFHAVDTADHWHLTIGGGPIDTRRADQPADVRIAGTAGALYRFVWNRASPEHVDIVGDASLVDWWRHRIRIRWS